jgi:cell division protein FtsA
MKGRQPLVAGLDIGTTKVCTVVGEAHKEGLTILGVGTHPNKGLRKGMVINLEAVVNAVQRSVEEAELMAGCEIAGVYAGISGSHIKSFNSHGMIPLKGREVTAKDIERVREVAGAVAIPRDREILHILPFEYIVDSQRDIRDPVGMTGVRLDVNCHIITGSTSSTDNIHKCCERLRFQVNETVFDPIAGGMAVLTDDEMEQGVILLDIGGGTSDLAVFSEGALIHTSVLPLAGSHITKDLAHGLNIPPAPMAENLKVKYGSALAGDVDPEEQVRIDDMGGEISRSFSRQIICDVIGQRCDEILRLLREEVESAELLPLARSGVVLTGGCARLPNIDKLAGRIFNTRVRIGVPRNISGHIDQVDDPSFSTAVGLALYGHNNVLRGVAGAHLDKGIMRLIRKAQDWIKELF